MHVFWNRMRRNCDGLLLHRSDGSLNDSHSQIGFNETELTHRFVFKFFSLLFFYLRPLDSRCCCAVGFVAFFRQILIKLYILGIIQIFLSDWISIIAMRNAIVASWNVTKCGKIFPNVSKTEMNVHRGGKHQNPLQTKNNQKKNEIQMDGRNIFIVYTYSIRLVYYYYINEHLMSSTWNAFLCTTDLLKRREI